MKFEIEIDCPEGWKVVAFRQIKPGEWYLSYISAMPQQWKATHVSQGMVFILERIKTYREPVLPADYGKVCEFSYDGKCWIEGKLGGYCLADWSITQFRWRNNNGTAYRHCRIEVTDETQG
jgi:hypothetical protein